MNDPLVTIAIPFYNNRDTIVDAVKSVFAQTYTNWELLLVDDGSTDGSLELVNQIQDPRVEVITDGINRGLVYRLNQISALGKGNLLARMDADDLMVPVRIQKQVDYFLVNPETELVDTGTYSLNENGEPFGIRGLNEIDYSPHAIIKKAMLLHASIMGKKEWFIKNPYDPNFIRAEDYELWCRTYEFSNFGRIGEPLYMVREGKVNLENYRKSIRTVRKIIRLYGPKMLNPLEVKIELLKTYLKIGLYNMLGALQKQDFLSAKRNRGLTADEKDSANEILQEIRQTTVPGWKDFGRKLVE